MKKYIISLLLIISCTISPVFAAPQESMEEKPIEAYVNEAINKVTSVGVAEKGYLEKSSPNQLYDPIANAGTSNYTKYAYDLASVNFYAGSLQGYAWCDQFVDWCFIQAFGTETAKQITFQNPYGSAACASSMSYYKAVGHFYSSPQPGDQIFFSRGGESHHTGLVYKVDGNTVYTVEGNTNSSNEVVANGDGVALKSYPLDSSRIAGYGRPDYLAIAKIEKEEADEQFKQNIVSAQVYAKGSVFDKLIKEDKQFNLNNTI